MQPEVESLRSTWIALHPWPFWLAIVSLTATLAVCVGLYFSEGGKATRPWRLVMASLRFCLFSLLLWMLAGWSLRQERIQLADLAVVLDRSESMQAIGQLMARGDDVIKQPLALKQILGIDQKVWAKLRESYRVRFYQIGQSARELDEETLRTILNEPALASQQQPADSSVGDPEPSNFSSVSRLGDGLNQVLDRSLGRSLAAVVFFSDGIVNSGTGLQDFAARAGRQGVPVHSIAWGKRDLQPDLQLQDLIIDRRLYLGDRAVLQVSLNSIDITTGTTRVTLTDQTSGSLLDQQTISLGPADNRQSVELRFVPKVAGQIKLKVAAEPVSGEADTGNNQIETQIQIDDRPIRVLLVFAHPSYEFRFLKHLFERSTDGDATNNRRSFSLTSVLQDADLDYVAQDASAKRFVPNDNDELSNFDLFIIGPLESGLIPVGVQQSIARAITEKGAGCMFIQGPGRLHTQLGSQPLASLVPVRESTFDLPSHKTLRWQRTKLGESVAALRFDDPSLGSLDAMQRFPAIETMVLVKSLKPGTQVWAEAVSDNRSIAPLLVTQFAGSGRTAFLATDETYRWTGAFGQDNLHQIFWGQMARWLSRGKLSLAADPELIAEPKQSPVGGTVRLSLLQPASTDDSQQVLVELRTAAESPQLLSLEQKSSAGQRHWTDLKQLPPGKYRARLVAPFLSTPPEAQFEITQPSSELANLRTNLDGMQKLAEISGGRFWPLEQAAECWDNLPSAIQSHIGWKPPQPLWNAHWVVGLFVLLITTEWLLRRRERML